MVLLNCEGRGDGNTHALMRRLTAMAPGMQFVVVRPSQVAALPPRAWLTADVAGIVLAGSEHNLADHPALVRANSAAIAHSLKTRTPLLAICFGFQCVMHHLTGKLPVRRGNCSQSIHVFNARNAHWLPKGAFRARMEHAFYYTDDLAKLLPPDVTVVAVARDKGCAQQVQAIEFAAIRATAFHPECRTNTACVLRAFLSRVQE
jgi:GMP synthase-like glutamine amidotransferase